MDPWDVVVFVALLCSLPALLVLLDILMQRPATAAWLRGHARWLAWIAVAGWGGLALRHWLAPGAYAPLAFVASLVAMVCMVVLAVREAGRSTGS